MIPLRIVETDKDDFDEPVVELWRDDEFVGFVFWDDGPIVQIFKDEDDDVFDLDLHDLLRVLDLAEKIVTPFVEEEFDDIRAALAAEVGDQSDWETEDPRVLELVGEFDGKVAYRNEDGEGFFRREEAEAFIRKADDLDLAVVEMEGFDYDGYELSPRPNLNLLVRDESGATWASFRPSANSKALQTLGDWPSRETLVIAFVVQRPDGEAFVA